MYQLAVQVQHLGIILLLIEIGIILYQDSTFNQSMAFIFTTASLINSIGYLLELEAKSMDQALYAVKFTYMGKPYIILSLFLFILHYCRIPYKKWVGILLYSIHTLIVVAVMTCDYQTLFYTSMRYTQSGLYPHMIVEHGIVYNLYLMLIVFYSALMLACCVHRLHLSMDKNEKVHLVYLMGIIIIPVLSYLIYMTDLTGGYDTTAISYSVCATLLLFCSLKYNFLGTIQLAQSNALENLRDGIIILDNSRELLYCNKKAAHLYPELETLHSSSPLRELSLCANKHDVIMDEREVYQVSENRILRKSHTQGSMIILENITDSYYYTERLQHDVDQKTAEVKRIQHSLITSFATLIESRDDVTGTHIKNTSYYVTRLCQRLQQYNRHKDILTKDYIRKVAEAAPLHDIGKIAIPDAILSKPGKLTTEEYDIIKTHAQIGADIIKEIMRDAGEDPTLEVAMDMANYHHERWDGYGYPCGLKEEEIPLCARIMAIADVYDALVSRRSYKDPYTQETALQIIKEGRGTQFDPEITDLFLAEMDHAHDINL